LIDMINNLAVVNYDQNQKANQKAIDRCPTGAIIWFNNNNTNAMKGKNAKKIIRKTSIPVG